MKNNKLTRFYFALTAVLMLLVVIYGISKHLWILAFAAAAGLLMLWYLVSQTNKQSS